MYPQPRLGQVVLPLDTWDGSDPIAMDPTVIQTIDYGPAFNGELYVQPVTVNPRMIPQILPELTTTAPRQAGWSWEVWALILGVGAWGYRQINKRGGGGASW